MAIQVIVELQARPGMRDELERTLESLESAEARQAHMQEAAATGSYAPLLGMLAAPFRVRVIRQLS